MVTFVTSLARSFGARYGDGLFLVIQNRREVSYILVVGHCQTSLRYGVGKGIVLGREVVGGKNFPKHLL